MNLQVQLPGQLRAMGAETRILFSLRCCRGGFRPRHGRGGRSRHGREHKTRPATPSGRQRPPNRPLQGISRAEPLGSERTRYILNVGRGECLGRQAPGLPTNVTQRIEEAPGFLRGDENPGLGG